MLLGNGMGSVQAIATGHMDSRSLQGDGSYLVWYTFTITGDPNTTVFQIGPNGKRYISGKTNAQGVYLESSAYRGPSSYTRSWAVGDSITPPVSFAIDNTCGGNQVYNSVSGMCETPVMVPVPVVYPNPTPAMTVPVEHVTQAAVRSSDGLGFPLLLALAAGGAYWLYSRKGKTA